MTGHERPTTLQSGCDGHPRLGTARVGVAARAALRLHKALRSLDIDSTLLTLDPESKHAGVVTVSDRHPELKCGIAAAMGVSEPSRFDDDLTLIRDALPSVDFDALRRNYHLRVPYPEDGLPWADGDFPTSSGRVEFASDQLEGLGRARLPDYLPPRGTRRPRRRPLRRDVSRRRQPTRPHRRRSGRGPQRPRNDVAPRSDLRSSPTRHRRHPLGTCCQPAPRRPRRQQPHQRHPHRLGRRRSVQCTLVEVTSSKPDETVR